MPGKTYTWTGLILSTVKKQESLQIIRYGLDYPPRTRAFLGALFENLSNDMDLEPLANKNCSSLDSSIAGLP